MHMTPIDGPPACELLPALSQATICMVTCPVLPKGPTVALKVGPPPMPTPPVSLTWAVTRDVVFCPQPDLEILVGFTLTPEMLGGVLSAGGRIGTTVMIGRIGTRVIPDGGGWGGCGWDAGLTATLTCRRVVPPQPVAVSVKVVVPPGLTFVEPGVPTPPMPGSMDALVAFDTAPQESVVDCPAVIVLGLALKDAITGGPGHAGAGGGATAAGCTVTVTDWTTVPPHPIADST